MPGRPGTAAAVTGPAEGQRHSAESRDIAQERLLLYLKSLNVPPGKDQLTLALDALTRLGADGGAHDITPAAMQSIRGLLKTSGLPIKSAGESKLYSMGGFTRGLEGLKSMPSLYRGHMLPVKFDSCRNGCQPNHSSPRRLPNCVPCSYRCSFFSTFFC